MSASLAALSDRDTFRVRTAANSSTFAAGTFGAAIIDLVLPQEISSRWTTILTQALTSRVADVPEQLQADWKPTVESQIGELITLDANWDSYGAPRIDAAVIVDAKVLASRLARPGAPAPSVVPTVNGTVQLEWHTRAFDAEIEIMAPNRYFVFTRQVEGEPWEGETTVNEALQRLQGLFSR